jgi:hypothetical protein
LAGQDLLRQVSGVIAGLAEVPRPASAHAAATAKDEDVPSPAARPVLQSWLSSCVLMAQRPGAQIVVSLADGVTPKWMIGAGIG